MTNELVEGAIVAGNGSLRAVPSGDVVWYERDTGHLLALDAATGKPVVGPLEVPAGCCGLVSDGVGGVWAVGSEQGGVANTVRHVDATGRVDAQAERIVGEGAWGLASDFDPSTTSIWVTHYERSVARIQLTPG